jgi:hypothetical protein
MAMKICKKCLMNKSLDEYYFNKRYHSYSGKCKTCYSYERKNNQKFERDTNLFEHVKQATPKNFSRLWPKRKPAKSETLIGGNWRGYYNWLEYTLPIGYSMDDYGKYLDQDHVIPISSFNSKNGVNAFIWYNVQLLPSSVYRSKNDKLSRYYFKQQVMRIAVFLLYASWLNDIKIAANKPVDIPLD